MSKVLLLGGTGAMGVYLREILAAEGKDVLVTSRSEQMPRAGVEFLRGDARDLGFLEQLQIVESAGQSTCAFYVMRA